MWRIIGATSALLVAAVAAALAGDVGAATSAKPKNQSQPRVTGSPVQGRVLHGDRGEWSGKPTDFNVFWQRCGRGGGGCGKIGGTDGVYDYRLTAADVGATLRFRVGAANADGRTWVSSRPTAIIVEGAPAPAPTGCPASTNPAPVSGISPPARLIVDQLQAEPSPVTRDTTAVVVRFHVTSTCGGPVQGALVYVTATPYDQFTIPPEQATGTDGWAELRLDRLKGFPVNGRQGRIQLFVRARKPGESLLAGVSARRLVSIRVDLTR
jgi:hypothetical protein